MIDIIQVDPKCLDYTWVDTYKNLTHIINIYNDIENKESVMATELRLQIEYNLPKGFKIVDK